MFVVQFNIETDENGDWTETVNAARGLFHQFRYVPDGTSPLATGADLDLVGAQSGFVLINQDNIGTSAFEKAPRQPTHDVAGTTLLYAASGQTVEDKIAIAEPITATIAQGGNAKKGVLYLWIS